jgi:uncharacterized SAM-binding protein YcdF (DUF218 family)
LVVLDGYHRLDQALVLQRGEHQQGWPILLITCPANGQPTPAQRAQAVAPLVVVMEQQPNGGDTAGQAVALAQWLESQPAPSRPAHVLLLSDPWHFPRAAWASQIAAGGLGTSVRPLPVIADHAQPPIVDRWAWRQLWPAVRDAMRLQLWRLSGNTGAFLNGTKRQTKVRACFTTLAENSNKKGGKHHDPPQAPAPGPGHKKNPLLRQGS